MWPVNLNFILDRRQADWVVSMKAKVLINFKAVDYSLSQIKDENF